MQPSPTHQSSSFPFLIDHSLISYPSPFDLLFTDEVLFLFQVPSLYFQTLILEIQFHYEVLWFLTVMFRISTCLRLSNHHYLYSEFLWYLLTSWSCDLYLNFLLSYTPSQVPFFEDFRWVSEVIWSSYFFMSKICLVHLSEALVSWSLICSYFHYFPVQSFYLIRA